MPPFDKTSSYSVIDNGQMKGVDVNPVIAQSLVQYEDEEIGLPIRLNSKEIREGPRLNLNIIEGTSLQKGTLLKISPTGLENSLRNKKDGLTFLGSLVKEGEEFTNDFIIPDTEPGVGKHHLVIRYNVQTKSYCLKDLGEGTGTFVRLDNSLALKNGYIISFGDSHMVVQLQGENEFNISNNTLTVRFLDGPKIDQFYSFTSEEGPVQIGRMIDCKIRFDDNSLSRYQCTMRFENQKWVLRDGDGKKSSTNGTWLFADEYFEIYEDLVFKAGQTLFQAKVINKLS